MMCADTAHPRVHHPIGRDHTDNYVDPNLVMELCHTHHMLCHDDWHTFNMEKVPAQLTLLEIVELALRRLAPALARVDMSAGGNTFWGRLAASCVVLAIMLARVVAAFDELFPEWRVNPVFYGSEGE